MVPFVHKPGSEPYVHSGLPTTPSEPMTVRPWRELIERMSCEVLDWEERPSPIGGEVLAQHPDVLETLLSGVTQQDLLCEWIEVWLWKRAPGLRP